MSDCASCARYAEALRITQGTLDLYEAARDQPVLLQSMLLHIREASGLLPGDGVSLSDWVSRLLQLVDAEFGPERIEQERLLLVLPAED